MAVPIPPANWPQHLALEEAIEAVLERARLDGWSGAFGRTCYGRCLLALKLNTLAGQASAADKPALYAHKLPLVRWAIEAALLTQCPCWHDVHEGYSDPSHTLSSAVFSTKTVIFVESGGRQFAFHFGDPSQDRALRDLLAMLPEAQGRTWCGIPLQPMVDELIQDYLERLLPNLERNDGA